ncbi:MAG: deoxyribodipyrimidine photo-lyase [Actinomycetota bacterium]
MSRALIWIRRDLRLDDQPAVDAALAAHDEAVVTFVLDPRLLGASGTKRVDQLFGYLGAVDADLAQRGARLHVAAGDPAVEIPRLVDELGAEAVYVNADATPYALDRDAGVERALGEVPMVRRWGTVVHPPGTVLTQKGTLSQVFTPFSKRWFATDLPDRLEEPTGVLVDAGSGSGVPAPLATPALDPSPGAVARRIDEFAERVGRYADDRDAPAIDGTSNLSVDLRFGAVSPRSLAERFLHLPGGEPFVRQLAWRDWYAHLLAERPDMPDAALKPAYDGIAWLDDDVGFTAWSEGRTGYPIVDAGMRQLNETGLMHNRVRMIVASFLVKDLLVDWRRGERYFRRQLLDADVASNVGNWQWVAGTGADAAPYFRIFNPISQSRKFDPDGVYVRRWVPELSDLDDTAVHWPHDLGPLELAAAGVTLGDTYPAPIVDHAMARERTLETYQAAVKG